jgi:integrase
MDEEVRKIITNASEPLSTVVAVTALLGLRIGETLALRTFDVDFAKHVNGRGRPFSANKLREKQLHPLLDALGIPAGDSIQ